MRWSGGEERQGIEEEGPVMKRAAESSEETETLVLSTSKEPRTQVPEPRPKPLAHELSHVSVGLSVWPMCRRRR